MQTDVEVLAAQVSPAAHDRSCSEICSDGIHGAIAGDQISWCGVAMLLIGSFLAASSALHPAVGNIELAAVFGLGLGLLVGMQQLWKEASSKIVNVARTPSELRRHASLR